MDWAEMKVAFVSGPYRADTVHGIVKNIRRAERLSIELWKLGYAVICPHKNTALLDGVAPDDVWLQGDLAMLKRCDVCVFIAGWEKSTGAQAEREFCKENGIEIIDEWTIMTPQHTPNQKRKEESK